MCLSIKIHRPNDVLACGRRFGFEWMVIHNGSGSRCGYVRIPKGHPWHGVDFSMDWETEPRPDVHGGITFAEPDVDCGKGDDDAWWLGFDAAHYEDLPDPRLPGYKPRGFEHGMIRTQEYMEEECRSLCDQALDIARSTV